MSYTIIRNFSLVVLSLFCVLTSCNKPVEVKQTFNFETSLRPGNDRMEDFTNNINKVLRNNAETSGADSTIQFQSNEDEKKPIYEDVAFLPVLTAEALDQIIGDYAEKRFRRNGEDHSAQVNSIDFTKNLVFLVSHPKAPMMVLGEVNDSGHAIYLDRVLDDGTKDNKRLIKLQSKRLGDVASGMASLMQKWESTVYILEKKNEDSLLVEIDKTVYPFSLKK
ncbi:hypothetical protein [Pedobacter nototheniae]|uniref:hypothetical protein n=1 Tax=Pedobacter nototheniae TaxID=2488994 RepID=UPI00292F3FD4|nr:hypothetical protein [Pedobacter nototheniae]